MSSFTPQNATVWFEIPVTDLAAGTVFYEAVTEMALQQLDVGTDHETRVFPAKEKDSARGHLKRGKPAAAGTGATLHLSVRELEPAMERVKENGGQVVSPAITIPSGRFAYCLDPDGNSFGIFHSREQ